MEAALQAEGRGLGVSGWVLWGDEKEYLGHWAITDTLHHN